MTVTMWDAPVRGLLLDIDDTLLDTRTAMWGAGMDAARTLWPLVDPDIHEGFSARYYADPGRFFDAYTRGALSFSEMRRHRFEEARSAVGLPPGDVLQYEHSYRGVFGAAQRLFSDVAGFVRAVRRLGAGVVFLTNSGADQTRLKLETTGLDELGPAVTTDTLGVGKPDPRVFAHARDLLELPAEQVMCVGDTLDTDIEGARRAGIRAAWIQRPGILEPRDAGWGTLVSDPGICIVGSLAEVADLLA